MLNYFIPYSSNPNTVFCKNTHLHGQLVFSNSLEIRGFFKGTIYSSGLLIITKNARVEAKIYSQDLIVAGDIIGSIVCTNKLELQESAFVEGKIHTNKIKVVDGSEFEGECYTYPEEDLMKIIPKDFYTYFPHILEKTVKDASSDKDKSLNINQQESHD